MDRLLLALLLGVTTSGCTDGPPEPYTPDGDGTVKGARLSSISVTPGSGTLKVKLAGGEALQFTATAHYDDGKTAKLTDATWSLGRALGKLDDNGLFTAAGFGGETRVTASRGGVSGTAVLTLVLTDQVLGSGVTGNDIGRLTGNLTTDPARAPALLYPEDETKIPFNLPPVMFQWKKGDPGNQLVGLQLKGAHVDLLVATYSALQWEPVAATWSAITTSAKGSTIRVTVVGTGRTSGALHGGSTQKLHVDSLPISGTIYYWATGPYGSAKNGIRMVEAGTNKPKDYYTLSSGGTKRCAGCHALSRDGKQIVFTEYDDPKDDWTNYIKGLEVTSKKPFTPVDKLVGDFFTFSPTGDRIVSSEAGVLTLRSSTDGAQQATYKAASGFLVSHPDWSPTEDRLALVVFPSSYKVDHHFCEGSIAVSPIDKDGPFSPKVIVASTGMSHNNYYPTFSPDGKHLAYNQAAADNNTKLGRSTCDMYANPGAVLKMISAAGGTPVVLQRANKKGKLTNSWPKWAPSGSASSIQTWWLAFSSTRDYGHRLINSTKKDVKRAKLPQIWVTAIDVKRLTAGGDPSFAAFWLPGQDTGSGNHIPFWTKSIK